jgi:hypothetical protein
MRGAASARPAVYRWFFSEGVFIVGLVCTVFVMIAFIVETRHRRSDVFRFARRQMRKLIVSDDEFDGKNAARELIEKLGYRIRASLVDLNSFQFDAFRWTPSTLPGLRSRRNTRPAQLLRFLGSKNTDGMWILILECRSASLLVASDFTSTTYATLEELVTSIRSLEQSGAMHRGERCRKECSD